MVQEICYECVPTYPQANSQRPLCCGHHARQNEWYLRKQVRAVTFCQVRARPINHEDSLDRIIQQLGDDENINRILAEYPKFKEFFIYLFSEMNARRV